MILRASLSVCLCSSVCRYLTACPCFGAMTPLPSAVGLSIMPPPCVTEIRHDGIRSVLKESWRSPTQGLPSTTFATEEAAAAY